MKTTLISVSLITSILILSASCTEYEDNGPIQYDERSYTIDGFTRIDARDALTIEIKQGNYFDIEARGDRRNLDDLRVKKSGNTLSLFFDEWQTRQHETYVTITMPVLNAAALSGATNSEIEGFDTQGTFDLSLSGASLASVNLQADNITLGLSGASVLTLSGSAQVYKATVTGSSSLKSFGFACTTAMLTVNGASSARISVSDQLHAVVSGASIVTYRGNPTVESEVTGASSLIKD
ncbi:MAG: head GIN domain-containing protein [Chryseotalea sp.]|jgi:hypothetical protein